jgi:hypothetical protein
MELILEYVEDMEKILLIQMDIIYFNNVMLKDCESQIRTTIGTNQYGTWRHTNIHRLVVWYQIDHILTRLSERASINDCGVHTGLKFGMGDHKLQHLKLRLKVSNSTQCLERAATTPKVKRLGYQQLIYNSDLCHQIKEHCTQQLQLIPTKDTIMSAQNIANSTAKLLDITKETCQKYVPLKIIHIK